MAASRRRGRAGVGSPVSRRKIATVRLAQGLPSRYSPLSTEECDPTVDSPLPRRVFPRSEGKGPTVRRVEPPPLRSSPGAGLETSVLRDTAGSGPGRCRRARGPLPQTGAFGPRGARRRMTSGAGAGAESGDRPFRRRERVNAVAGSIGLETYAALGQGDEGHPIEPVASGSCARRRPCVSTDGSGRGWPGISGPGARPRARHPPPAPGQLDARSPGRDRRGPLAERHVEWPCRGRRSTIWSAWRAIVGPVNPSAGTQQLDSKCRPATSRCDVVRLDGSAAPPREPCTPDGGDGLPGLSVGAGCRGPGAAQGGW